MSDFKMPTAYEDVPCEWTAGIVDKAVPQGANGHLDKAQEDWLRLMPDGWDGVPPVGATDVLHAIDKLRRDLTGYHGQLKAHNDLQRHCDNQRKRIVELEWLYAGAKDEVAELKEQTRWMAQTDSRWEAAVRDLEQAKAENAKLRELVRSFHSAMLCTLDTGMWPTDPKWLEERMEELGVEVDG